MRKRQRRVSNILVTGGAGFIGSAFVRYVLQKPTFEGAIVTLDALTYAGNRDNLAPIWDHPRHHFVHGDIGNQPLLEHLCLEHEIDTILHCAAETHVDRSIDAPHQFLETNILGTYHLLEVVRRHPHIHFHHVSTDEVYGALGHEGTFTEESPYRPNSPYSASKAASDHFVRAYEKTYGLSICMTHTSNNFGPYQYPEKLIPLTLSRALQNEPIPIYGQGEQVRDWLYVEDHADALWTLLHYGKAGGLYNIGGGVEKRNIDLVHDLLRLLSLQTGESYQHLITFVDDRPGHDFRYALDTTKLESELQWSPQTPFHQALNKTIAWTLHHAVEPGNDYHYPRASVP